MSSCWIYVCFLVRLLHICVSWNVGSVAQVVYHIELVHLCCILPICTGAAVSSLLLIWCIQVYWFRFHLCLCLLITCSCLHCSLIDGLVTLAIPLCILLYSIELIVAFVYFCTWHCRTQCCNWICVLVHVWKLFCLHLKILLQWLFELVCFMFLFMLAQVVESVAWVTCIMALCSFELSPPSGMLQLGFCCICLSYYSL